VIAEKMVVKRNLAIAACATVRSSTDTTWRRQDLRHRTDRIGPDRAADAAI
jgi:hypothetical protein